MRQCPSCDFLIDPDTLICRFCGTDLLAARDDATHEAALEASRSPFDHLPATPLTVAIAAAVMLGLVIVAILG